MFDFWLFDGRRFLSDDFVGRLFCRQFLGRELGERLFFDRFLVDRLLIRGLRGGDDRLDLDRLAPVEPANPARLSNNFDKPGR